MMCDGHGVAKEVLTRFWGHCLNRGTPVWGAYDNAVGWLRQEYPTAFWADWNYEFLMLNVELMSRFAKLF